MEDRIKRDKAFIGAIIKGVGALAKGIISARKAKKQAQQQQEIANRQIINQNNAKPLILSCSLAPFSLSYFPLPNSFS